MDTCQLINLLLGSLRPISLILQIFQVVHSIIEIQQALLLELLVIDSRE